MNPNQDIDPTSEVLGPEEQGPSTPQDNARDFQCEEEVIEHFDDLADVQSAVGMLLVPPLIYSTSPPDHFNY